MTRKTKDGPDPQMEVVLRFLGLQNIPTDSPYRLEWMILERLQERGIGYMFASVATTRNKKGDLVTMYEARNYINDGGGVVRWMPGWGPKTGYPKQIFCVGPNRLGVLVAFVDSAVRARGWNGV